MAKSISSTEIQRSWGAVVDEVHAGETVKITSHGRPLVVIIPPKEYEELLQARRQLRDIQRPRAKRDAALSPAPATSAGGDYRRLA